MPSTKHYIQTNTLQPEQLTEEPVFRHYSILEQMDGVGTGVVVKAMLGVDVKIDMVTTVEVNTWKRLR